MRIIITVMFLVCTNQLSAQLTLTTDKENVVASALEGSWAAVTDITNSENADKVLIFKADNLVLDIIPEKFHKFLLDKTIYWAGYLTISSSLDVVESEFPCLLTNFHGNPHLVFFLSRESELDDAESFNLFIAKGEEKNQDRLFVGGDFNNQDFKEYERILN